MRVSLLNHCNLGCVYCVAGDEVVKAAGASGNERLLTVPALLEIIGRLHGQLQLETIRLTGGEPLLYHGLVELIREAGTHLATGFLATPFLLPVLADSGHLMMQDDPSAFTAAIQRFLED